MTAAVPLRSSAWFAGDDEVALAHRVAVRSVGFDVGRGDDRPVIGIANSSSDLNPCNLPLAPLVDHVHQGIVDAGGIPMVFPVMSLGEDLMKPSAMLYRNLLAMEVEEYLRSYPLDGVVLLANCDKSVPGALMGALSADLPTLVVTAGARRPALFRGRRVGAGTDTWRMWQDHRTGVIDDDAWAEYEACLSCGLGACNTMGTASSMAILVEALGLSLPGASTIPVDDPDRSVSAYDSGRRIVEMVRKGLRPSDIVSDCSLRNALRVLAACGGSTNAVLHLLAIAGRGPAELSFAEIGPLCEAVPVLADVEPSGRNLIQDFHAAGGVPTIISRLGDLFDRNAMTATGRTWEHEAPTSLPSGGEAIRDRSDPLVKGPAFVTVLGNIAPRGALLKASAASPGLFDHAGPALVFRSYEDMRNRIDDPALPVTEATVLVLCGAGPCGAPGMPEWGMIPIPAKLAAAGVTDMVRITDSRMSGTSFGTCFLHVAPEAAIGGPIALIEDGDIIEVDVPAGRIHLDVSDEILTRRRLKWTPPVDEHLRGWPALYRAHVLQADLGCDFDFLSAPTPQHRRFVPPIVGRS